MNMRILQVVDSLDPIYGGPPTVVLRLAAALAREGAQVTLYSQERSGREADIAATLHGIPGIDLAHLGGLDSERPLHFSHSRCAKTRRRHRAPFAVHHPTMAASLGPSYLLG